MFKSHTASSFMVSILPKVLTLFLLFFSPPLADVTALSHNNRAVNDYAGVLSTATEAQLENYSVGLFKNTGVALAFLTVDSLGSIPIEVATVKIFEKWKIGDRKKDEGVLVLLAPNDQQARIEVGYGAEGYLTDLKSRAIIEGAINGYFKSGNWNEGALYIDQTIIAEVCTEKGVDQTVILQAEPVQSSRHYQRNQQIPIKLSPLQLLLLLGLFIIMISTRTGRGILQWMILIALSSRSGGGGGGFGSMGGGGFGGFGGGSSGGGGATGRW